MWPDRQQSAPSPDSAKGRYWYSGGDLFSQEVAPQVSSARTAFTTVFGMGTGGTPSLRPPEIGVSSTVREEQNCVVGRPGAGRVRRASLTARPPLLAPVASSYFANGVISELCVSFFFSYGISLFWNDYSRSARASRSCLQRAGLGRPGGRRRCV